MPIPAMQTLQASRSAAAPFVDPTSIGGLALWLDADDASSFTFSSGALVSQWNDKSGGGRHFTQATTTLQPTRDGVGAATQNGRRMVTFTPVADGNDYMQNTASSIGLTNITAFMVFSQFTNTTGSGVLSLMGSSANDYDSTSAISYNAGDNSQYFASTINNASPGVAGTGATPIGVYSAVKNGTALSTFRDGAAGGTATVTATGTANTRWLIGIRYYSSTIQTGSWLPGYIAEIVVYDSALSTTNRQAVEAYLKAKWGTP